MAMVIRATATPVMVTAIVMHSMAATWAVADRPVLAAALSVGNGCNWGGSRLAALGVRYPSVERREVGG